MHTRKARHPPIVYIDSLDGLTFWNQLMSIMLVMPTGQHLHTIFSFLASGEYPEMVANCNIQTRLMGTLTAVPTVPHPLRGLIFNREWMVTPCLQTFLYSFFKQCCCCAIDMKQWNHFGFHWEINQTIWQGFTHETSWLNIKLFEK